MRRREARFRTTPLAGDEFHRNPVKDRISLRPIWPKSEARTVNCTLRAFSGRKPRAAVPPEFWQSIRLLVLEFVAVATIGGVLLLLLDLPVGFGSVLAKLSILWLGRRWTKRARRETVPAGPVRLAWLPFFAVALVGLVLTLIGHAFMNGLV